MKRILLNTLLLFGLLHNTCASFFNNSRIVIIADVHADIQRFNCVLQDSGILDGNNRWIAEPNTIVVQLGDQIDPKEPNIYDAYHHFEMIYHTHKLQKMAETYNGKFVSLIGNHELYNIDDIRKKYKLRKIIAERPIVYALDKYIFCHGGFHFAHYRLLSEFNKSFQDLQTIWYRYVNNMYLDIPEQIILDKLILDRNSSILFTRTVDDRTITDELLDMINADYIFVGHTTVEYIRLEHKVWYLDLYLKDAFDKKVYSYIVIENNTIVIKVPHFTCHIS